MIGSNTPASLGPDSTKTPSGIPTLALPPNAIVGMDFILKSEVGRELFVSNDLDNIAKSQKAEYLAVQGMTEEESTMLGREPDLGDLIAAAVILVTRYALGVTTERSRPAGQHWISY